VIGLLSERKEPPSLEDSRGLGAVGGVEVAQSSSELAEDRFQFGDIVDDVPDFQLLGLRAREVAGEDHYWLDARVSGHHHVVGGIAHHNGFLWGVALSGHNGFGDVSVWLGLGRVVQVVGRDDLREDIRDVELGDYPLFENLRVHAGGQREGVLLGQSAQELLAARNDAQAADEGVAEEVLLVGITSCIHQVGVFPQECLDFLDVALAPFGGDSSLLFLGVESNAYGDERLVVARVVALSGTLTEDVVPVENDEFFHWAIPSVSGRMMPRDSISWNNAVMDTEKRLRRALNDNWQGWQVVNRTSDEEQAVDVEEIRRLLDEEVSG
jgi:hypothetical protein